MRRQATVSTVKQNRVILDYAKTVWQNTEQDVDLINLIMSDWWNNRQRDSKSGMLREIKELVLSGNADHQKILEILGRTDAPNDTDHT